MLFGESDLFLSIHFLLLLPSTFSHLWLCFSLQPVEGANEFLQLLKSHKEKLEEGMRELRRKNEEMERERDENEKERERMRRFIEQLRTKLAQAQVTPSAQVTQTAQITLSE